MLNRDKILKTFLESASSCEQRIQEGIEQNRKGNFSIVIKDENGKTCPNANISVTLKKHDFVFGANIFLLDELDDKGRNETYKMAFSNVFNLAVAPFYWDALEPNKGNVRFEKNAPKQYRRPAPDLVLEFCKAHDIKVKGHPLMWHLLTPSWLPSKAEDVKFAMGKRFREISERYSEKIEQWDVVNESLKSNLNSLEGSCRFGIPHDYTDYCFRLAEANFPGNKLLINEQTDYAWETGKKGRFSPYYLQIEGLLNRGRRIDGIGMQYHLMSGNEKDFTNQANAYLNPKSMLDALDYLGEFNRPIQISEISVSTITEKKEDEALQAEIVTYLYRLWFSHKNVEAIIWWNLADGYAYSNGGGWDENVCRACLLRKDMSPKPSYFAIETLINKEWRTQENLTVDENGEGSFRGFYGCYDIEIITGSKKTVKCIEFPKNSLTKAVIQL